MATTVKSRTLAAQLSEVGFRFPFTISDLIDKAIRAGTEDPFAYVQALIINSKRFEKYYPGIKRANGTLRMSPAQYETYVDTAKSFASSAGLTVSRKQIGGNIGRNISLDEFQFRVTASQNIVGNKDVLDSLNERLLSTGRKALTTADRVFDFIVGRYTDADDLFEEATIEGAAASAGIDIDRSTARRLGDVDAGILDFDTALQRFQRVAAQKQLADVELRAFGLSDQDLFTAEFGGRSQGQIEQLRSQAIAQRQAALQNPLATQQTKIKPREPEPSY